MNNPVKIDTLDLPKEWELQPGKFLYHADLCVEAQKFKDEAKMELETTYADLDKQAREGGCEGKGSKPPTEDAIKQWILRQEEYQRATKNYINACYEYEKSRNVKDAFIHRKAALEHLQWLFCQGHYSGLQMPKAMREKKEVDSMFLNEVTKSRLGENERVKKLRERRKGGE